MVGVKRCIQTLSILASQKPFRVSRIAYCQLSPGFHIAHDGRDVSYDDNSDCVISLGRELLKPEQPGQFAVWAAGLEAEFLNRCFV